MKNIQIWFFFVVLALLSCDKPVKFKTEVYCYESVVEKFGEYETYKSHIIHLDSNTVRHIDVRDEKKDTLRNEVLKHVGDTLFILSRPTMSNQGESSFQPYLITSDVNKERTVIIQALGSFDKPKEKKKYITTYLYAYITYRGKSDTGSSNNSRFHKFNISIYGHDTDAYDDYYTDDFVLVKRKYITWPWRVISRIACPDTSKNLPASP